MTGLDETVTRLGNGQVRNLSNGDKVFIMDSYEGNPIVFPQQLGLTWRKDCEEKVGSVFNCGAEVHDDKVYLLPRCHSNYRHSTFFNPRIGRERACLENYVSEVWVLVSEDGVNFQRFHDVAIKGDGSDHQDFEFGVEDIRIIKRENFYILIGCGKIGEAFKAMSADRIAIYTTKDFKNIVYKGMVADLDLRNAVIFPEPVSGKEYIFLRFRPNIHLDSLDDGLDQLLHPHDHQEAWQSTFNRQDNTIFVKTGTFPHEKEKLGPGPQLIKTEKGWLFLYHTVGEFPPEFRDLFSRKSSVTEQNQFVLHSRTYTVCAALLDLKDPRKILRRTKYPIYVPSKPYELFGDDEYGIDVPAVIFPVGAIVRKGKLLVYAGAADKYVILLSCNLKKFLDYLWEFGIITEDEPVLS